MAHLRFLATLLRERGPAAPSIDCRRQLEPLLPLDLPPELEARLYADLSGGTTERVPFPDRPEPPSALRAIDGRYISVTSRKALVMQWLCNRDDRRFVLSIAAAPRLDRFAAAIESLGGLERQLPAWGRPPLGAWLGIAHDLVMKFDVGSVHIRDCLGPREIVRVDLLTAELSPSRLGIERNRILAGYLKAWLEKAAGRRGDSLRIGQLEAAWDEVGTPSCHVTLETWRRADRIAVTLRRVAPLTYRAA